MAVGAKRFLLGEFVVATLAVTVTVAATVSSCGRSDLFPRSDVSVGQSSPVIPMDNCVSVSTGFPLPLNCDPASVTRGDGTVLACGRVEPTEVAVEEEDVYWVEATGIVAFVTSTGDGGHILQCSDGFPGRLASDARNVYWSQSSYPDGTGTNGIFSLNRHGGQRQLLASPPEPLTLVRGAMYLFWSDYILSQIQGLALDGPSMTTLASNQPKAFTLALTSSEAYWADYDLGQVMKVDLQPGSFPVVLATGQLGPIAVSVNSHSIFWANDQRASSEMSTAGTIVRLDDVPGAVAHIIASGEDVPAAIVADDDAVYWTANSHYHGDTGGTIRKLALDAGGSVTTLAGGQVNPGRPVISGGYLYWANEGDGTIRRIAK
jgi:hypothetical protein